jgi:hypothetical protein
MLSDNLNWLKKTALLDNDEYRFRFDKQYIHKSSEVFVEISSYHHQIRDGSL